MNPFWRLKRARKRRIVRQHCCSTGRPIPPPKLQLNFDPNATSTYYERLSFFVFQIDHSVNAAFNDNRVVPKVSVLLPNPIAAHDTDR